jgi:hypothetical protein
MESLAQQQRLQQNAPFAGNEVPVKVLTTFTRPCHQSLVELRLAYCTRISGYDLGIILEYEKPGVWSGNKEGGYNA